MSLQCTSHALLRLVSGLAQPITPPSGIVGEESNNRIGRLRHRAHLHCMQNEDGAFCWRDGCEECLSLTKATQATSEALATLSDLYEANVKSFLPAWSLIIYWLTCHQAATVLMPQQELLVETCQPYRRYKVNLLYYIGVTD